MSEARRQPNILIFMPDQMQAMVTWPEHPCKMPNVERLAREGVSFRHAYPPMAHCCPARASFLTGLYPSQHGVYNNVNNDQAIRRTLYPGIVTFPEKLADAGYRLYYTGKYHISAEESPADRGWEELNRRNTATDGGSRRSKYRESQVEDPATRQRGEIVRPGWLRFKLYGTGARSYEQTNDYANVQSAVDKLGELARSDAPWCMYVGTDGPHDPFFIPQKYAEMYDPNEIELPPNYHDDMADKPRIYQRMRAVFAQLSEDEVKESIAHYWGYCTMIDDLFGEVMEALERTEQGDDTIVLFVSDHGEHAGAHGLYCKGISTFDEGYRVPFVIRAPRLVKDAGRIVDQFVTLMDIAPTLIEAGGAQPLSKCSGSSLLPFLKGEEPAAWRDSFYAQCNGTELYYISRMVKTRKYKFVYNPTDLDELYDLEHDPYELVNVAARPEMAGVLKQMYKKMWENAFASEDMNFVTYIPTVTGLYGPSIINERQEETV